MHNFYFKRRFNIPGEVTLCTIRSIVAINAKGNNSIYLVLIQIIFNDNFLYLPEVNAFQNICQDIISKCTWTNYFLYKTRLQFTKSKTSLGILQHVAKGFVMAGVFAVDFFKKIRKC